MAQVPDGYSMIASFKIGNSRYFRFQKNRREFLEIAARCDE